MRHLYFAIINLLSLGLLAQNNAFIENKGQWGDAFDFKYTSASADIYISGNKITTDLHEFTYDEKDHDQHNHPHHYPSGVKGHVFKWIFSGSHLNPEFTASKPLKNYHNYILGDDPNRWKSEVKLYENLLYKNIYPNTNLELYFSPSGDVKYDLILKPGAQPKAIVLKYSGADDIKIVNEQLVISTSMGEVTESKPYAYQIIEGQKIEVTCSYQLKENTVTYQVGKYNTEYELIIDPTLIYSTYSGSTKNNFGFTATHGIDETAYGGGIVFSGSTTQTYPTTTGAYQSTHQGGIDIGISKYDISSGQLIYSTYLGGNHIDIPYSLLEGPNKSLIILGKTGSTNYPVTTNAYQSQMVTSSTVTRDALGQYGNGQEIVVTILDSTGGSLEGSTYLGDSDIDGYSYNIYNNYGDYFRGDIALDNNGNIIISSSTLSSNFPVKPSNAQTQNHGGQDGVLASFNSDLSNLNWSTCVGGSGHDALFGMAYNPTTNRLYATGGSRSQTLGNFSGTLPNAWQDSLAGYADGFTVEVNPSTGSVIHYTYNGTPAFDLNFLIDYDLQGNVYITGQSFGDYDTIGNGLYTDSGTTQFIQKFSHDLSTSSKAILFGYNPTAQKNGNLSATGLMVDSCGNLYLSGWGANYDQRADPQNNSLRLGQMSNTQFMQTTPNAVRQFADQGDFYFMILDPSWKNLKYATQFGEFGDVDHVDGGTSRFRRDGTIFQAVCASCGGNGGFPVTQNAYSTVNPGTQCNLAVFVFQLETDTTYAQVTVNEDSTCIPYTAQLVNRSYNFDFMITERPNGQRDTLFTDTLNVNWVGARTFKFIAVDTSCHHRDSVSLTLHGIQPTIHLDFDAINMSCDSSYEVSLINNSTGTTNYIWTLGNGDSLSSSGDLNYIYPNDGVYNIALAAYDSACGKYLRLQKEITVRTDSTTLDITPVIDSSCAPYQSIILMQSHNADLILTHKPDGTVDSLFNGILNIDSTGYQSFMFIAIDTICNTRDTVIQEFYGASSGATIDFNFFYDSCSTSGEVSFESLITGLISPSWNFGDTTGSFDPNPTHQYELNRSYNVTLRAWDTLCNIPITVTKTISTSNSAIYTSLKHTPDSLCIPFKVALNEGPHNYTSVKTILPDGSVINQIPDTILVNWTGGKEYTFIVEGPTCNLSDTTQITLYGIEGVSKIDFTYVNDSCDGERSVIFQNLSDSSSKFVWYFGDGDSSILFNPTHLYAKDSSYTVTLWSLNKTCDTLPYLSKQLSIYERNSFSKPRFDYVPCHPENQLNLQAFGDNQVFFEWFFDDQLISTEPRFTYANPPAGTHYVKLITYDSICKQSYEQTEIIDFITKGDDQAKMPNVFTPNGDGFNDLFKPSTGNPASFYESFNMKIYNRWGVELFSTNDASTGWDGRFENNNMPEGVYYYLINYTDICGNSQSKSSFVHLNR